VTPTDIADELWRAHKIRVDRRKIELPEPIKRIGRYEIPIELFTDVTVEVKTEVVPEGGELPPEEELEAMVAAEEAEAAAQAEQAKPEAELEYFEDEPAAAPAAEPEPAAEAAAASEPAAAAGEEAEPELS